MDEKLTVCPECGRLMTGLDPLAHALEHWPEILELRQSSVEARARQAQCRRGGIPYGEYIARTQEE